LPPPLPKRGWIPADKSRSRSLRRWLSQARHCWALECCGVGNAAAKPYISREGRRLRAPPYAFCDLRNRLCWARCISRFSRRLRPSIRSCPAQMTAWLDENCSAVGWTMTPSGTRGVLNDALSIYFCGRYAGEHSSLASASRQRLRRLVGFGLRSRFPSQLSGSRYKMLGNTTSRITRAGETH